MGKLTQEAEPKATDKGTVKSKSQTDYDTGSKFCHEKNYKDTEYSDGHGGASLIDDFYWATRGAAKTIFTLQLPVHQNVPLTECNPHIPGESGDGTSFPHRKKDSLNNEQSVVDSVSKKEDTVKISNGVQCKIRLPITKDPILVLLRKSSASSSPRLSDKPFIGKFYLRNPTDLKQAYKCFCSGSARNHFTVYPNSGVIPPHSRITIIVKTYNDPRTGRPLTNEEVSSDKIFVKFFPAYFATDEIQAERKVLKDTLNVFLKMLHDQHPDLIHKSTIHHVFLYDVGDHNWPTFKMKRVSSADLKYQLLIRQMFSKDHPSTQKMSKIWSAKLKILANYKILRRSLRQIIFIRNVQEVVKFLAMWIYVVLYILPYFGPDRIIEGPAVIPKTWWNQYLQSFMNLFQQ